MALRLQMPCIIFAASKLRGTIRRKKIKNNIVNDGFAFVGKEDASQREGLSRSPPLNPTLAIPQKAPSRPLCRTSPYDLSAVHKPLIKIKCRFLLFCGGLHHILRQPLYVVQRL